MHKGNEESGFNVKRFAQAVLIGSGVSVAGCLLILLAVSGIILSGNMSEGSSGAILMVVLFISTIGGGFLAAGRHGSRFLIVGAVQGIVVFLIICLIGLIFYSNFLPSHGGVQIFLSGLAGSISGAMLKNRNKKTGPNLRKKISK
ncbi:MAG: TIGR04086 family membrane protein [Oscillospiraceae bacterium]|jgi:putative membrane protein (TIGR04086 family)|nr:TIGR04086 family membrane protein [Oscillospiraceae bacterium]